MLIKRLYLRNFRVYEEELDLDVPPGLVGVYGPNGAGKSTLLEVITWTLWGRARTTKEQVRSAGVGSECVTEVSFEHEGHLYLVRRTVKGANSTVTVEAHCDGALMSSGRADAERYVESVLGMDDAAFRASVFTEQKQLAAFSSHPPGERRKLVLGLLGITPLDAARDAARRDARELKADHDRVRGMLADLPALETAAADAEAAKDAAEEVASREQIAAGAARSRAEAAREAWEALDVQRQEHDALVAEGKGAREALEACKALLEQQREELGQLDLLAGELAGHESAAEGLDEAERAVAALGAVVSAIETFESVVVPVAPADVDETAVESARTSAADARESLARLSALSEAAEGERRRASEAAQRSESLTGEADCPVCGQALGSAFEAVQAHRSGELEEASSRAAELAARFKQAATNASAAEKAAALIVKEADLARKARLEWAQIDDKRRRAEEALQKAWNECDAGGAEQPVPPSPELTRRLESARATLAACREATSRASWIHGRLDAKEDLQRRLAASGEKADAAEARVEALRDKVRALAFDRPALQAAAGEAQRAEAASQAAATAAQGAEIAAARERERASAAQAQLESGREQHAKLADLESEARHTSRTADLLSEFRNTVVASVGPRLAVEASDLFAQLTDHEYETLEVDPETYQMQIRDGGKLYGLERFSGSEVDLANLALRVAISEHIHFQSGGSVGLLVLDEVFGPLDEDRKGSMLEALERLKGRFRQVIVVTHDSEIKDQLPNAIEVVKLPGRRATAHVLGE